MANQIVDGVAIRAIESSAQYGWKLLKKWLFGKVMVVIGQDGAGKTTFIDNLDIPFFIQYEQKPIPTVRTTVISGCEVRILGTSVGANFKKFVDNPGVSPKLQAEYVYEQQPHVLVIFTDLTTPIDGAGVWLRQFCRHLNRMWIKNKERRVNHTEFIIIVMNKHDKLDANTEKNELEKRHNIFNNIIDNDLQQTAKGKMMSDIPILPCTAVNDSHGNRELSEVIFRIVRALRRQQ